MTVYIVTTPRGIQAVFGEYEQAKLYCAIREGDDEMRIEMHDTETIHLIVNRPLLYRWVICVNSDWKVISKPECYYTFKNDNRTMDDNDGWMVIMTVDKEITEDQAKEIALDRIAKWSKSEG